VASDEGAKEDAEKLAKVLGGLKTGFFKKTRKDPTKKANVVSSLKFYGDVKGKNAILFDDMVDTGGTIIEAKEKLISLGAGKIILCTVHPILSGNVKERLEKANFSKIFFSNSIPIKENPPFAEGCGGIRMKNLKIIDIIPEIKKYLINS
jgi:ribose-phosphate pyrophosphokinase